MRPAHPNAGHGTSDHSPVKRRVAPEPALRDAAAVRPLALVPLLVLLSCGAPTPEPPLAFVVTTFNTGTTDGLPFDQNLPGGYGAQQAEYEGQYYGHGLAWLPVIDETRAFFAEVKPDLVGFQEIFHPGDCAMIPPEARVGFVCESWKDGDPTVAQMLLGEGYQVACHVGHPDKCAAVKKSFGHFRGCDSDLCLDGLDGAQVVGCGKGSRIGRAIVDLARGGELTLVNVHGSSGFTSDDQNCRKQQFDQVFVDLDGAPAASGDRVVVIGDFNTDPWRLLGADVSADELRKYVGPRKDFHFITQVGDDAPGSYAGLFDIDHVISNVFSGSCWIPGLSNGRPPLTDTVFFDHLPHTCIVSQR